MEIAERLFSTMKQKKITQEQLAKALNTNQPTIAHWKAGTTKIPIEYIGKICKLLNISTEYLITGKEEENHLTPDEKYLVEQYRKVKPEGQKNILKYVEFELFKQ
ncbi:MAG: helix-turn-helix transcriptional regulator [Lachnospiraceae bacterium]|nr:helix-turn-helix transcriptional regulator [Lachnospiraceae bacterium]